MLAMLRFRGKVKRNQNWQRHLGCQSMAVTSGGIGTGMHLLALSQREGPKELYDILVQLHHSTIMLSFK